MPRTLPMDNGGMSPSSRLSDRVAERLRALIAERGLRPGDRLPAERALAVNWASRAPACARPSPGWPARAC
jgi:DNA-binding GntR family transcriptional regulator